MSPQKWFQIGLVGGGLVALDGAKSKEDVLPALVPGRTMEDTSSPRVFKAKSIISGALEKRSQVLLMAFMTATVR